MKLNVLLVGVGGQGILTSAAILARAALKAGVNVITAETHGMAQRGGSVEVHVRFGDVKSPLIPAGAADVMVALEPVEALRYTHYLNENSTIILNTREIIPPSVTVGNAKYPTIDEIIGKLKEITENVYAVEASSLAEKAGSIQSTNVVVLGVLSKIANLPFGYEKIEQAVKEVLPEKLHEINMRALKAGYDFDSM